MHGGETPATVAKESSEWLRGGGGGERGTGGKLRRERKPPSTPYDRPPRSSGGGWISSIVTPAKRLISGGATRLLPSFFSPIPPTSSEAPNRVDERSREIDQEAPHDIVNCSVDCVVPKSTEEVGPSKTKGKAKLHGSDEDRQDKVGYHSDGRRPDIEQLIRGNKFSREEIDRLMEVLRSRVVDAEQEKQLPSMSGQEETESAEKSHEKQIALIDKEEELENFKWTRSPALPQPTLQDEIGASPVDLARAYMGSRMSDVGFVPTGSISKTESFMPSSKLSTKPLMPSPLPRAPTCWPGAITQDHQGYSTPQSQKSRYGLQAFPRTPYSRTMYSKTNTKFTPFQGDSERKPRTSLTPFQPMRTPVYGKSTVDMAEGSYGSGGPMRRMRNKLISATPAKVSTMPHTAHGSPWTNEFNKNFEPGTSSISNSKAVDSKPRNGEVGTLSVHPHSSKLARQILEQLDRPITLKEKSEELKLVGSWKNPSQAALAARTQNNLSPSISEVGDRKNIIADAFLNAQTNHVLQNRTNAISDAGKGFASSSMMSMDKMSANVWSSPSAQKNDFLMKSSDQLQAINCNLPKGNGQSWLIGSQSKGLEITNNSSVPDVQNVQRRPVLPSISIDKSGLKTSFASDTSAGFTFPVTTSSGTSVEPPTPSIMPSSSTSPPQKPQQSKNSSGPTFSFGNKITIAPPVFSFPSTSNASTPNSYPAPKFNFGSGKTRLSFALVESDAAFSPNDAATPKYKFGSGESRLNFGSIESDGVCCS